MHLARPVRAGEETSLRLYSRILLYFGDTAISESEVYNGSEKKLQIKRCEEFPC